MEHKLPPLPYDRSALAPQISAETIDYHYGKHHATYVQKLNGLIGGTEFENMPLVDIVRKADGGIFNNGAQAWNHTFYWNCLTPEKGTQPSAELTEAISKSFGSMDELRKQFLDKAMTLFGSGWVWLQKDSDGSLSIENLGNAGNPITAGKVPILTCDMWEHAYYIDYRNGKGDYLNAFWNLINWEFVSASHAGAEMKVG